MRISDWSSDVCSSDLALPRHGLHDHRGGRAADPVRRAVRAVAGVEAGDAAVPRLARAPRQAVACAPWRRPGGAAPRPLRTRAERSEEHTSELQSLMRISYAVFCLKKKKKKQKEEHQALIRTYK